MDRGDGLSWRQGSLQKVHMIKDKRTILLLKQLYK